MKIIAYTALHYGTDYLGWAIRSLIQHVDEYYVLYAAEGSHGHRTTERCPDSREDLLRIAREAAGSKLCWIDGTWPYEGAQRDSIHQICPDADAILVLDADEVWPVGETKRSNFGEVLANIAEQGAAPRRMRLPMIHFWRSFSRAILHDPAFPVRIIFPKLPDGERTMGNFAPICHMGYAQRSDVVRYKQLTHGHRGEWRKDCDWFADRFMANAQQDCHPVGSKYWNPESVDPWRYLPDWMQAHPFADLEVIP